MIRIEKSGSGKTGSFFGLKPGDTFKDIDGEEYILWYYLPNGDVMILKKDCLKAMKFGSNNNYDGSYIDKFLCNTYLSGLERKFGKENIVEHDVDLFSMDGEYDYGTIKRKVSIPTFDAYRNHKKAIKKYLGKEFWLSTPSSTPGGYLSDFVQYINPNGNTDSFYYHYSRGVLPCFVLKASIFES